MDQIKKVIILSILVLGLTSNIQAQTITYTRADTIIPDSILINWTPHISEPYTHTPAIYQDWWREICVCAHLHGDMHRIHWWRVTEAKVMEEDYNQMAFYCPVVTECIGWSSNRGGKHNIYIAYFLIYEEKLIKHEMLHDLLGPDNYRAPKHHPLFQECGV